MHATKANRCSTCNGKGVVERWDWPMKLPCAACAKQRKRAAKQRARTGR